MGDEREVDDNVRMTGIEPLQLADWIISAGTTEEAIVRRERTGDGRQHRSSAFVMVRVDLEENSIASLLSPP